MLGAGRLVLATTTENQRETTEAEQCGTGGLGDRSHITVELELFEGKDSAGFSG
jgi:hypothetical protein